MSLKAVACRLFSDNFLCEKMAPKSANEELDVSSEKEEGQAGSWAEGLSKGTDTGP
jgi:hypothetical protein